MRTNTNMNLKQVVPELSIGTLIHFFGNDGMEHSGQVGGYFKNNCFYYNVVDKDNKEHVVTFNDVVCLQN